MKSINVICFLSLTLSMVISGCTSIPTTGPSSRKIVSLSSQKSYEVRVPRVEIVEVDWTIIQDLYHQQANHSFIQFGEGYASVGTINSGDILDITIWEAPPAVLFGGGISQMGSGSAQQVHLEGQMVGVNGTITIPFAGNLHVIGKTPEQIQDMIKGRLNKMAHQPQVMVRLAQNNAANVSVIRPGNSIRLPLTAAGERVLDAVAAVGGSTANVQDTNVQLTRGNEVKTVALEELVANPRQNILLRKGDIVTLITNPYTFTSMGAVGHTQEIGFSARGLSLAEAVGRMGGLQDRRSDARGVFVFRYTPLADLPSESQAKWLAQGYGYEADIPVVYRVNLQEANSLFWMQRFPIKNKDVLYVSNAPLAEVQKFLSFIFSPVTSGINSIDNLSD